ncbi:MAG: guanylate kinase [Candidatus Margulisbacteria bacterium]|nr:guanylate kinase [Candidatus Margulisiibacteriota bacterium]
MLKLNCGAVIIISGPSGVGKGTLISQLLERRSGLKLAVSATTRFPRLGEVSGVDYYFMSREEFMVRVERSEFVEWCEVHGNLYGTLKQEIDKTVLAGDNVLLEIDTQGAKKVLSQFDRLVRIFIAPPSELALLNRLRQRDTEDETTLARRLETASQELKEQHLYDYIVVNEVIEDAVQELMSIIDTVDEKES